MERRFESGASLLFTPLIIATLYFILVQIAQHVAIPPSYLTAVWVPVGIGVASVIIFGGRAYLGIFVGVFLASIWLISSTAGITTNRGSLFVSGICIGLGVTVASMSVSILHSRFLRFKSLVGTAKNFLKFAVVTGGVGCLIGAALGVAGMWVAGLIDRNAFITSWLITWLSAATSVLVLTPAVLTWFEEPRLKLTAYKQIESVLLLLTTIVVGIIAFAKWPGAVNAYIVFSFLAVPLGLWASVRFGTRITATTILILFVLAAWGSVNSLSHDSSTSVDGSLWLPHAKISILTVALMCLAVSISHRKRIGSTENLYKTACRQTADHWYITDIHGVIREVSPSLEKLSGYSSRDLVGQESWILCPRYKEDSGYQALTQTIASGEVQKGIHKYRTKNGEVFYSEQTITPIRDEKGVVSHYLSLGRDITDQKRMEEELGNQEERLRSTLSSMDDLVFALSKDGVFIEYYQPQHKKDLYAPPEKFLGKHFSEVLPPSVTQLLKHAIDEVVTSNTVHRFDYEIEIQGRSRWYSASLSPRKKNDGLISGITTVVRDITDRKLIEEEVKRTAEELWNINKRLTASEQALVQYSGILESVLNNMSDGVIVANQEGHYVMSNKAAEEIMGIRQPWTNSGDWLKEYECYMSDTTTPYPIQKHPLMRAINGEYTSESEMYVHIPKTNRHFWINMSGRPLKDERGDLRGGMIISKDISESKLVENIKKELKANEEEFEVAREIQENLFPLSAPRIPGFDISGITHPAVSTGGDYYDYIDMPDGTLMLVVGDVSGHGFGPALLMASARAYLHALTRIHSDTDEILNLANELIASDTSDADFITLILACLDPVKRTFKYASAGHETCYLFDRSGEVKMNLESTGPPLGVILNNEFTSSHDILLNPGDILLLLTDGIVEAETSDGMPFGHDRFTSLVKENRQKSSSELLDLIYKTVREHSCHETNQIDDITAVVVKVWSD